MDKARFLRKNDNQDFLSRPGHVCQLSSGSLLLIAMMCSHGVGLCSSAFLSVLLLVFIVTMTTGKDDILPLVSPFETRTRAPPLMGKELQKACSFFFNKVNVTDKNDGLQTCCRSLHTCHFELCDMLLLSNRQFRFFFSLEERLSSQVLHLSFPTPRARYYPTRERDLHNRIVGTRREYTLI